MTRFFIDLHGCAKNQVDAEIISTYLIDAGYLLSENAEAADLIIINSCGFIKSAKEESIGAVIDARNSYKDKKIILAGCLAERYAEYDFSGGKKYSLAQSLPEADGIFGNGDLSKIVDVANRVMSGERTVEKHPQAGVCAATRKKFYNFKKSAYVKITEGCSNHCSFCAIPIIRGELRSRPIAEIVAEIKSLVEKGFYEINLIGQDLAAYGTGRDDDVFSDTDVSMSVVGGMYSSGDGFEGSSSSEQVFSGSPLSLLLRRISALEGKFIVRLLYIHPDHFNPDILDVMKSDSRFLHYFDIPFQSGSDKLISMMNRVGSFKSYVKMISDMKAVFPDMVLRTTFMTGFPGETDSDFGQTLEFLKAIRPDWSGCFCYSREEDTPAYDFRHRVSDRKAKKRATILEEAQEKITAENLEKYVGNEYDVLIEEIIPPMPIDAEATSSQKASETGMGLGANPSKTQSGAGHSKPQAGISQNTGFNVVQENSADVEIEATEGLAIGRAWFQAPEVDGAVVVRYETDEMTLKEGDVVRVKILAVSGIDLDGVALRGSE